MRCTCDEIAQSTIRPDFAGADHAPCSGLHGYSHENPVKMTIEQQHAILDKTYKQLTEFCGKPPRGSVAPWWESSKEGSELMLKYGVEYGRQYAMIAFHTGT